MLRKLAVFKEWRQNDNPSLTSVCNCS